MMRLVISDNEGSTTVVPLARDEISIGRKDGNTIRLTERNISRKHAVLSRENGAYRLQDLGSYNGVLVNGRRVVGDTKLELGDEIQIGDYTLLVEADQDEKPAPVVDEQARTQVAPAPRPGPLPRLIVLLGPRPGQEFPLPAKGSLRIGRADDLDISFDHRSVSREHAEVRCLDGHFRIADLTSANGVLVNGVRVDEVSLNPGDQIELGEVLLRFVPQGESFVFNPEEAARLSRARGLRNRGSLWLAAAIVSGAVLAAFFILTGDEPSADPHVVQPEPVAAIGRVDAVVEPGSEPSPAAAQVPAGEASIEALQKACRDAIAGARYAEAMAHAVQALKLAPGDGTAAACEADAKRLHEQEQTFVRGKAALEAGDIEAAYGEFARLPEGSDFLKRPEVAQAAAELGSTRLDDARKRLRREPAVAQEIASGVLALNGQSDDTVAEAQRIVEQAERAMAETAARPARSARPARPTARAERPRPAKRASAAGGGASAMETASACLARGDNACVVRALNGKARTAQELGLLIETYRAMGNSNAAYKNMAIYVRRFPTARRAATYEKMLARRE